MTCFCGTFFCYRCGKEQPFDHGPCKCRPVVNGVKWVDPKAIK